MEPVVETKNTAQPVESLSDLTKNPQIIKLYTNGFQCGVTLGDGSIIFKQNDTSICLVSMSLPALKSLHEQLGSLIGTYTKDIMPINSFEELKNRVKK